MGLKAKSAWSHACSKTMLHRAAVLKANMRPSGISARAHAKLLQKCKTRRVELKQAESAAKQKLMAALRDLKRLSSKKTNDWDTNVVTTCTRARSGAPAYDGPCKKCGGKGYTRSLWNFLTRTK